MKTFLPKTAYFSYASPLIGKHSLELFSGSKIPDNLLINNCFSENEFEFHENDVEKIQFVWFSQNIAAGRGLERALPALYEFKDQVQLNLIGNLYPEFYNNFLIQYADILQIIEPLPQKELNKYICQFDIGLAIELATADYNREICLTNKIFAFSQAGLYILATNTSAQKQFMEEHKESGIVSGQSIEEMQEKVSFIIQNIETIRKDKKKRFENAKKLSWESESQKLVEIWAKI
jgi:glycosyltransferase involved in cell wall biosynthesis